MATGAVRKIPFLTMRLRGLISCLFLLLGGIPAVRAQQLTWNLEWGFTGTFFSVHDLHYKTQEGYHMDPRYHDFFFHANGLLGVQAGIRTGRWLQWDLCTGYYGLQRDMRSIPAGLRGTCHFGKQPGLSGLFGFAEGGVGFSPENWKKNADYARAGIGYRIPLGAGAALKLMFSGQLSQTHPLPYDPFDDMIVDPSRLSRSNRYSAGLTVSAAIGF